MKEIWKDIKGYEGLYQVSKSGKIKSIRNNIYLKPNLQVNGYLRISLSKNGKIQYKNIHRLVAETFIDNENNYPVINHIDGNKLNNNADNLEWCSYQHNNLEARRLKLNITKKGKFNHKSRIVVQYDTNGNIIKVWDYMGLITKTLGYDYTSISRCCSGKQKTSYGYIWKYKEA